MLPFSTDAALRRRFMIVNGAMPANLRWGRLFEELDDLAEEVALAYVRGTNGEARVVTAAIDDIVLHIPADVTCDLDLHARINYVGRSSMEVGIRVDQSAPDAPSLASCYFTMVARTGVGAGAASIAIDPLDYVCETERFRRDMAVARRQAYQRQVAKSQEPPSAEEFLLLAELHREQERRGFNGLLAGNLERTSWERMYPEQENVPEKIFGGHLIYRAFELAHLHAEDIAPDRPVFARVDRINFLEPVRIGDKLRFTSRIVYTGDTSMCVEITIERRSADRVTRAISNTCVFTFVNVDDEMNPRPVPKVYPTTYAEDARYLEAHRRRLRLQPAAEPTGKPSARGPQPEPAGTAISQEHHSAVG